MLLHQLAALIKRTEDEAQHMGHVGLNIKMHVKDIATMGGELGRVAGRIFEEEYLRHVAMLTTSGGRRALREGNHEAPIGPETQGRAGGRRFPAVASEVHQGHISGE